MSKSKKVKKVVVTTSKEDSKVKPTVSRLKNSSATSNTVSSLSMNKSNYMWMLAGIGLIALGFALMAGGKMPSSDVWDEGLIYSFRRITLAPMIIIAGLAVEVYAIFKK